MPVTVMLLMSANISRGVLSGYVGAQYGRVYYIDFETGQYSAVYNGSLGYVSSLEYDGNFFYAAGQHRFYKIDAETGREVFWEPIGHGIVCLALAPDGALYGVLQYKLITVNKDNGNITEIGNIGLSVSALAIDRNGRALACADAIEPLIEINLSDASFISLGDISKNWDAFDFGPDDNLYGWKLNDLYRIDIDAVTSTHVGHYHSACSGEGFALIPEPATLLMLVLGAVMLRRKR